MINAIFAVVQRFISRVAETGWFNGSWNADLLALIVVLTGICLRKIKN
jgi:hypothetical protein